MISMDSHHALLFVHVGIEELPVEDAYKQPSQDVTHIVLERFGIDDARALTKQAFQRPLALDKRVFVLVLQEITTEAQNALLKLFEEPPATAVFYILVEREGVLLPTLRSRLQLVQNKEQATESADSSFLQLSLAEQLDHVATLAKEKDKEAIEVLLGIVEKEIAVNPQMHQKTLSSLLFVRSYMGFSGASSKMLLEELVLSLPR